MKNRGSRNGSTRSPVRQPPAQRPQRVAMTPQRTVPQRPPAGPPGLPPDALDGLGMEMMGPSDEQKLVDWLMSTFARGPAERIELRQTGVRGEAMVRDWQGDELGDSAEALASEIYASACDDASTAGGVTRYCVQAYRPGSAVHCSRCFFRVAPTDVDSSFESEEGWTGQGLTQQAHRHLEGVLRLCLGSMNSVVRGLQIQNAEKDGVIAAHNRLQLETLKLQQEILDRKAERDLATQERKTKLERIERNIASAERMLWVAAPHLLVRMGLPPALAQQMSAAALVGHGVPGNGGSAPTAAPPIARTVDPELVALGHRVTTIFLRLLCSMEDAEVVPLLGQLPPDAAQLVQSVRATVTARQEGGDARLGTDAQREELSRFADLVGLIVGGADGLVLGGLLARLPSDDDRTQVLSLRTKLLALRGQQPTTTSNATNGAPAQSGVVSTAPANGHTPSAGTNGAPTAPTGAGGT